MPEYAKTYEFANEPGRQKIDGQEFPWYIHVDGPVIEPDAGGYGHILWVPILVDAPMPHPPSGRPSGEPVWEEAGIPDGPLTDFKRED